MISCKQNPPAALSAPKRNLVAGGFFQRFIRRLPLLILLCPLLGGMGMQGDLCAAGTMTTLHDFARGADGQYPQSELTRGNDGNFYGTTANGGTTGEGTAFKMTPEGQLTTLHTFSSAVDGSLPNRLTLGSDGNFYGTCTDGGDAGGGTIFKMTAGGTVTVLHQFLLLADGFTGGLRPGAGLVQGTDGNFYGTTRDGGLSGIGTLFKMTPTGTFTTLHSFMEWEDGRSPQAELIQAQDGALYGTAFEGGSFQGGTVFKITTGGVFTVLHAFEFNETAGVQPAAALVQAVDGNFYGTTFFGANGGGSIFKMTPEGMVTALHAFEGEEGGFSSAPLVQGLDGYLYGTAPGGSPGGTLFKVTTAGVLTVLDSFEYNDVDGSQPQAGMILDAAGNLFGTTYVGGEHRLGSIFRITTAGVLTSLYSFSGGMGCYYPVAPLVQGSDGAFYGTASRGGASESGAIFMITAGGTFNVIHALTGISGEGAEPQTGLVEGSDGAFYGTTRSGGVFGGTFFKITPAGLLTTLQGFTDADTGGSSSGLIEGADGQLYGTSPGYGDPAGSVFKMTLDGVLTAVHAFTGGVEYDPEGRLLLASDGKFYGITYFGGAAGKGSIYSLTPEGVLTTLFSFTGSASDGEFPNGGLAEGSDGSIYGTTISSFVAGIVFKITKAGAFTKIHTFTDDPWPNPDLIRASDGSIYGTTPDGGAENAGTIFKVATGDVFSVVYSFQASSGEGVGPQAGVIQGTDGKLYGTTIAGGINDVGTVFQFTLPAPETRVIELKGKLAFGNVGVGTTKTATFRIQNSGNSPLHLTRISYPKAYSGSFVGTIPAGGFQNVTVTFAPTSVKPYNGTLLVISDATSGANSLPVTGRGVSRIITLSGNMAFGSVPVGGTKRSVLTIRNTGNSPLSVTGITYPSPAYTGNFAGVIPPGGAQNVTVTFKPTAPVAYNGNLKVNGDQTSGTSTIAISGTGRP